MADSMIERVARALCRHNGHPENIKFEGKPMWQSYVEPARAVLTAMRDPTPAMITAGEDETDTRDSKVDDFERGWKAAIDAALQA